MPILPLSLTSPATLVEGAGLKPSNGPGHRREGDTLAPMYQLKVEGTLIEVDFTKYIQSIEFESAADLADVITITVNNPGLQLEGADEEHPDLTAHKIFQPGNEVELRGGYGRADTFIGRAILAKHLPNFPEDGMPTLVIKGYDKSHLMMDIAGPVQATKENKTKLTTPRPVDQNDDQGTAYVDMKASDIVAKIADKYGFTKDIDATTRKLAAATGDGVIQKKGMKDYELVRILANLNIRDFFVDYDPTRKQWVLHWVKPNDNQQPELVFSYGKGDDSSLLSFECEYGIRESVTTIVVLAWDRDNERWISAAEVEDVDGIDPKYHAGGGRMERAKPVPTQKLTTNDPSALAKKPAKNNTKAKKAKQQAAANTRNLIDKTIESATQFRLAAAGTAIDIRADKPFESLAEATEYAQRWFKARKDAFLVGKGRLIGVESLKSRQVHRLEGLGPRLSGNWYFISVTHRFEADGGYTCDFTARKVID